MLLPAARALRLDSDLLKDRRKAIVPLRSYVKFDRERRFGRSAVESAVTDVLRRAIAFSPTIVTLEKATLVGNRLYLVLFLTDEDGETSASTLPGLGPSREDPIDSPEKAPRTTM